MFLHLAILSGFSLFAELNHSSEIVSGVSRILAASVFGQELFLLHYHSTDHIGVEGHYHWLLQIVVSVSLLASLVVTCSPSSFPAALVLSISISLQGCWFIVMGFMLWVPKFVPQGCATQLNVGSSSSMHGAVICMNQEAEFRAKALANLQLSWVLSAILICVATICLVFSRTPAPRGKSTDYEKLQCVTADASLALTGLKQTSP
ncbi:OLC1v1003080C1 [Oldenlandia corymbosa var. corymbosa]|uniref:OLC1v1003080C1 n=1 Tax=Oldenlandia corymbosa var. corymbosa TaxID=529605 RepID=A0AAV1DBK6_OLDCO|nr:OLC1v1003080C1 [Oldenlandia corymbosa var. corymbosa]